jgi:glutamyl-tRNA reductase
LPRDVEAAVGELDNVFLYDLDDLRAAAAANLETRGEDVPAAQRIIADEVQTYWDWVASLAAVPVVREFREGMEKVRTAELAAALKRMGPITPEQQGALEHFSKSLMNKFLHEPSVRLKAAAANGRGLGVVDAARYLFALGEPADSSPPAHEDSGGAAPDAPASEGADHSA